MDPLFSHLLVAAIVGIASGGLSAVITNAVQNWRIKALERRADKIDKHLDRHDIAFAERVVFKDDLRDKCEGCAKLDNSQHESVLIEMKALKGVVKDFKTSMNKFQTETVEAFRSCTDDLVKALKEENA